MSGNEAAAIGAIAAGCNYYAGYPITPSSELMERMSVKLGETGGTFIQMEDEISSICSLIGAVWAGAKGMTATSGPGFDLMQEGIGYAVATETPLVLVDCQRAGPATGQATRIASGDVMQAKWGSHGDYEIIAISPWSVQEMHDQIINAFNCSERYRVPVFVLADEGIAHLQEKIHVGNKVNIFKRAKKKGSPPFGPEIDGVFPMPNFGEHEAILVSGTTHLESGARKPEDPRAQEFITAKLSQKILNKADEIVDYDMHFVEDADIVIIAYGFTARSALYGVEYLRKEGKKVGLLRLKTIWPFAGQIIGQIGSRVKTLFVPEMNKGQVAGEVMKYARCNIVALSQTNGEVISPLTIIDRLRRLC